jgi:hypothetical protein
MGRTSKAAALLLSALALSGALAACGGGGDSASSSTTASTPSASSPSSGEGVTPGAAASPAAATAGGGASAKAPKPEETPAQKHQAEARERKAYERKRYGSPSPQSAPFAKHSSESSGKSQPKLHLAEFGEEASGEERGEAQEVLAAYLQAAAAGEWERACEYLLGEARAQLEDLAKEGGGCGEALRGAVEGAGGGAPALAPEGIASLRVQKGGLAGEGAGFALFRGSDGEDRWVAMKRQDGEWKVLSIAPLPFGK